VGASPDFVAFGALVAESTLPAGFQAMKSVPLQPAVLPSPCLLPFCWHRISKLALQYLENSETSETSANEAGTQGSHALSGASLVPFRPV